MSETNVNVERATWEEMTVPEKTRWIGAALVAFGIEHGRVMVADLVSAAQAEERMEVIKLLNSRQKNGVSIAIIEARKKDMDAIAGLSAAKECHTCNGAKRVKVKSSDDRFHAVRWAPCPECTKEETP